MPDPSSNNDAAEKRPASNMTLDQQTASAIAARITWNLDGVISPHAFAGCFINGPNRTGTTQNQCTLSGKLPGKMRSSSRKLPGRMRFFRGRPEHVPGIVLVASRKNAPSPAEPERCEFLRQFWSHPLHVRTDEKRIPFFVYRVQAEHVREMSNMFQSWKAWLLADGIGELHVVQLMGFSAADAVVSWVDGIGEFWPLYPNVLNSQRVGTTV